MTGHADGYLRFIDGKTVLVNDLKNELKYWQTGFNKMIEEAELNFIEIPWFIHKDSKNKDNAIGAYVNYLEMGNLIIFPIFEVRGNKDNEAMHVIESIFPDRIIEPVNINEIANDGGLLNCISWTIKI